MQKLNRESPVYESLLLIFLIAAYPHLRASAASPLDDAIAAWHMNDTDDSAGINSRLAAHGQVRLGVPLSEAERVESALHQGDGLVAVFEGGWLSADQGANAELNLHGRKLSIAIRLKDPTGKWRYPIFSKYGGHSALVYNVFAADLSGRRVVGAELGTTGNNSLIQASSPIDSFDPCAWHDLLIRCDGARLELFVDGYCTDEDFILGDLRQDNALPVLIGAQALSTEKIEGGFTGLIDHVVLWDRALTMKEVAVLAGRQSVVELRERTDSGRHEETMQYWRPPNQYFVGDCMPFYHEGLFHFVYLLDRRHHAAKNGLGAHQWAQATSRDLIHWQHQPLMLRIDEQWEGSICTGSTLAHQGKFYAAYATRAAGTRFPAGNQYFNTATSEDGVHFAKAQPNPLNAPPTGFATEDWRDPFLRYDTQERLFHILITARDLKQGGCLAHLVSKDLKEFEYRKPLLYTRDFPGTGGVPECPDWFAWGDWQYLIYNGCYLVSKTAFGPWRLPENYVLDGRVMKTAPFAGNRRIGVAWISHLGFGNRAIFREAVQRSDGTLGWKFVEEMNPRTGEKFLTPQQLSGRQQIRISNLPMNCRVTLTLKLGDDAGACGLRFRELEKGSGIELRIDPKAASIQLGSNKKPLPSRPTGNHKIQVFLCDEITDVCIDEMETLILCAPPGAGRDLVLWSENPSAELSQIEVHPLLMD